MSPLSPSGSWLSFVLLACAFSINAIAIPQYPPPTSLLAVPRLSGSAHVIGPGAYARANFLADGSILASFTGGSEGNRTIMTASSKDHGSSWTMKGIVASQPDKLYYLDNAYPLQLANGRILIAYLDHTRNGTNNWAKFSIDIRYSDDKGATWKFLSSAVTNPGPVHNGLWEPFLRLARDGSLQLYYSHEISTTDDQVNLMRKSLDGGKTWSKTPITVSSKGHERDGMTGVTTIEGNNLIAVFESFHTNGSSINSVTSSDDGNSWGNRRQVYVTDAKHRSGSPQVINVGGTLVASFMTDECSPGGTWGKGAQVKLLTSTDRGASWGHKLAFWNVQSNWPSLLKLDNTSFLGFFDNRGAKTRKIELSKDGTVPKDCSKVPT